MKKILNLTPDNFKPAKSQVLQSMGYRDQSQVSPKVGQILEDAYEVYSHTAKPAGILLTVSIEEFGEIYRGLGKNERENPLLEIFPQAENLALTAFTLGIDITRRIEELFKTNDYTLAALLDSIASAAADQASKYLEFYFFDYLVNKAKTNRTQRVLLYSPGYCGWHISGQEKLFAVLKPEAIGLSLHQSYLMIPLKSLSGVLIAGDKNIHLFKNDYSFCKHCKDQSCIIRKKSLSSKYKNNGGYYGNFKGNKQRPAEG